jgi:hypothetical protein
MRAFLVDIATLKKIGFVNSNVEDNIISTTLRRVQKTMLEPILGTTLYDRLQEGVDNDDLNANETTLLNDYIVPVLVAAVDLRIVNHVTFEIRSKSVGTTSDQYLTAGSKAQLDQLKDDLRQDYNSYRTKLIGYLCENDNLFPEYEDYETDLDDIAPEKGATRTNIRFT